MSDGRVLYAHRGKVHVFRYVGDIRYPLAPSIDSFVDQLFGREHVQELLVDLCEADSIDSTNLGELARIALRLRAEGGQRPVIVSTREDINRVLRSMAMDEVFELATEESSLPEPEQEISQSAPVRRQAPDLRDVMLEAHRTLMDMSDENRERFFDVVALMESSGADARHAP